MCVINRECKMQPIHAYYKQFKDYEIVQYVGIASDEPKRLARLAKQGKISKVSLLDKYGYTENMARQKCLEYGLLSPIYRGGATRGLLVLSFGSYKGLGKVQVGAPGAVGRVAEIEQDS